jgi:hypothetical protein
VRVRPRVRLPATTRKRPGHPPERIAERQLGSCIECIKEDLRRMLEQPVADATHAGVTRTGKVIHIARVDGEPDKNAAAFCGRRGLGWYRLTQNPGIAWRLKLRWCALCLRRAEPAAA